MISMVPPGNDVTTVVSCGKLRTNWNNGYHPYHNHEAGKNIMKSEGKYQGGSITERVNRWDSSVRKQKFTGHNFTQLEISQGSITHAHYDYTIWW